MGEEIHHIVVLVEDRPGVMQKVSGLMRKRNFNIDSITVGYSEKPGISRIILVVRGDQTVLEQVMKQLNKLIEIIKVIELNQEESVVRELVLAKVSTKTESSRAEIVQYANIFRGRIVDVRKESLIVEITGNNDKVEAFLNLMKSYGIKEIARTGKTIMSRTN